MSENAPSIHEALAGCAHHRGSPSSHCQACADVNGSGEARQALSDLPEQEGS